MSELNLEWENFMKNEPKNNIDSELDKTTNFVPKCLPLYISTQTKIGFLNKTIPLEQIFWNLPIIDYHTPKEGIIKKIIKINSNTKEDVDILEEKIENTNNIQVDIISKVDNVTGAVKRFKDIRKIIVGISKKDLINFRKKKKSAFYNCFAVIVRIFHKGVFKEINIKLFNTGKLEIPGIKEIETLFIAVNLLTNLINSISNLNVKHIESKLSTVLINSNFSCNYYINRDILYNILKFEYGIHSLFDSCSYPGIQCKYFYNISNKHTGVCNCKKKCDLNKKNKNNVCRVISFMVFRTGSILVVGNCNEEILKTVYDFIVKLLTKECDRIRANDKEVFRKKKEKKYRKRIISFIE
tara:strand:- start:815 stop:1876 length:1062 start_codon:yes stop_codon:yes gene_type:complete